MTTDQPLHDHVTAYRITTATGDVTKVGWILMCPVETGQTASWNWVNFTPEKLSTVASATGRRIARVCPKCFAQGVTRNLGHPGRHGGDSDIRFDDETAPAVTGTPVYDDDTEPITGHVLAHLAAAKAAVVAARDVMDDGWDEQLRPSVVQDALTNLVAETAEVLRALDHWDSGENDVIDLADDLDRVLHDA